MVMNLKELLLEGCRICMPYKGNLKEWVGETKIFIFEGGFGLKPKILVEGDYCDGYRKEFELNQIDEAIKYFNDNAFNSNNRMYKMNEVMRNNPELDLDEEEDLEIAMKARELLLKK